MHIQLHAKLLSTFIKSLLCVHKFHAGCISHSICALLTVFVPITALAIVLTAVISSIATLLLSRRCCGDKEASKYVYKSQDVVCKKPVSTSERV